MKWQLNVHNAVVLLVSHETSAEFFNSRRLNRIQPHISSRLFIKSPFPFEKINTTITGLSSLLNFVQLFKRETFSQIKLHLKRRYSAFLRLRFELACRMVDRTDLKLQTIVRSRLGYWGTGAGDIPEASALSEWAHPNGAPYCFWVTTTIILLKAIQVLQF